MPRLLAGPEKCALHKRPGERAVVHFGNHAGDKIEFAGEPGLEAFFERVLECGDSGCARIRRTNAHAGRQTQRHREKTSSQQAGHETASSKSAENSRPANARARNEGLLLAESPPGDKIGRLAEFPAFFRTRVGSTAAA